MNRLSFTGLLFAGLLLAVVGSCSKPPGQAEYDRGLYELKRGNPVRAKALLETSISKRPGAEVNALAYNYLGVAEAKLGQLQSAQESFEDSRRLGPGLLEPVLNLGALAVSSGDQVRALRALEEAVRMDPADTRALEQMAALYRERQQWPEARRMLYAALDRAPNTPRLLTAIAQVECGARSEQKAVELLVQALEHNTRYAPALFNLALVYDTRLNDGAHARSYYRRFLNAVSKGPQADFARRALERLDRAPEPEPEAGAVAPAPPPDLPVAPVPAPAAGDPLAALLNQASQLVDRGNPSDALKLLLDAAEAARREGRVDERARLLRETARLCFDEPRAHYELGLFLLASQQPEAALRSFKQATTLDRNYGAAHFALARAAMQTGEHDAALVGFQAAAKADPRNADALWELAQVLDLKMKNADRATPTYREFERLFPGDPRVAQAAERIKALAPLLRPAPAPTARTEAPRAEPSAPAPRPGTLAPAVAERPRPAVMESAPEPAPVRARTGRTISYRAPVTPNPAAALTAFREGFRYQQQGNWESAIFYYLRSLENDDRPGTTFYNLGSAYAARGEAELALDAYGRALELQPELTAARYNLALLYFQAGDVDAAERHLRGVVREKPDYAAAHYTLGMIYAARPGAEELARQSYQRYVQLAPNEPSAAAVRQWLSAPR